MSEVSANMSLRQAGRARELGDLARMGEPERAKRLAEIVKSLGLKSVTLPELRAVHEKWTKLEFDALERKGL